MAYHSSRFSFSVDILQFARPGERDYLAELLREQGISSTFNLTALRRRQYWAITVPQGLFTNDFRPGFTDYAADIAARDVMLAAARRDLSLRVRAGRATIENRGDLFYHQHVIDVIRRAAPEPAFLNALHAFLCAAQEQPALIKGTPQRRPYVPLPARSQVGGRLARGPAWAPEEDLVLRQWFGQRTYGEDAGKHVVLTEPQWAMVLERLGGRRTKGSVRARLAVLNFQLKCEMSVDGYVPKQRYAEYFQRVLGENPRPPRVSPLRRRAASAPRGRARLRTAALAASTTAPATTPTPG